MLIMDKGEVSGLISFGAVGWGLWVVGCGLWVGDGFGELR